MLQSQKIKEVISKRRDFNCAGPWVSNSYIIQGPAALSVTVPVSTIAWQQQVTF